MKTFSLIFIISFSFLVNSLGQSECDPKLLKEFQRKNLDVEKIKKLVNRENINCDHGDPIIWASILGNLELTEYFISLGADVNVKDFWKETPIFIALENGHLEVAKTLRSAGADINIPDSYGNTPLYLALERGNLNRIKTIVSLNPDLADLNKPNKEGDTYLLKAIKKNDQEMIKLLVSSGADVNIADVSGKTPLILSIENDNLEAAKTLISSGGVNIQQRNDDGKTPLYYALSKGNPEMVKLLMNSGANPKNIEWLSDENASLFIATEDCNLEIAKLLIAAGIDVNFADRYDGQTPIFHASENCSSEMVKFLISSGADVTKTDNNGKTPIYYVYDLEIRKLLIASGANPKEKAPNELFTSDYITSIVYQNHDCGTTIYTNRVPVTQDLEERIRPQLDSMIALMEFDLKVGVEFDQNLINKYSSDKIFEGKIGCYYRESYKDMSIIKLGYVIEYITAPSVSDINTEVKSLDNFFNSAKGIHTILCVNFKDNRNDNNSILRRACWIEVTDGVITYISINQPYDSSEKY
jgi:ankyrin repeat protein